MIKYNFYGNNVDVFEHISELKNKFKIEGYVNRFFNKKQMFNFFLGKDIFIDEDGERTEDEIEIDSFDDPCCFGRYVNCSKSDDILIEFYKASDTTEDSDFARYYSFEGDCLTFIKDDSGEIWIIKVNED